MKNLRIKVRKIIIPHAVGGGGGGGELADRELILFEYI
jgi:hypothetical protein